MSAAAIAISRRALPRHVGRPPPARSCVGFHIPFAGDAQAQATPQAPEINAWVVVQARRHASSSASPAPRWARAR